MSGSSILKLILFMRREMTNPNECVNISGVYYYPIWDKRRSERAVAGRIKYKPKRDDNGVIQCKSKQDMETCLYADGVRVLRQKEYDNMALFTDQQMEMAEQSERSKCNVLEYIEKLIKEREELRQNR